jgi:hypothetical protein
MDIVVRTGGTRNGSDVAVASFAAESGQGDQACFLLQVEGGSADLRTLKGECKSIIDNALLGVEGDAWDRLDGTLKELNGLFKGFAAAGTFDELHAIVAIVDTKGALHISAAGRAEAYLLRDGTASQITEVNKGKSVTAFVHISSGQLEAGDTVVCATHRLLRVLTPAQMVQLHQNETRLLDEIQSTLEAEREVSALGSIHLPGGSSAVVRDRPSTASRANAAIPSRRSGRRARATGVAGVLQMATDTLRPIMGRVARLAGGMGPRLGTLLQKTGGWEHVQDRLSSFIADLKDPKRKRRAHLLLFAAAVALFVVVWSSVTLLTSTQRSKTKAEITALMDQINEELRTADNRRLAGDMDAANTILQQAEEQAKQVMDNESGLYRVEALDLISRIVSKREEINNILRTQARMVVSLASKESSGNAQGFIGLSDGEFVMYNRDSAFRVILNRLDEPKRITEDDLILLGANFPRYKSQVFMTTGNSVMELSGNDVLPVKTDDPNGWVTGKDIETYLRYLYILSPEKKQIYKYERLTNRYAAPVQYNVNGDLTGALDMAVDSSVFVLKDGGVLLKLLRGEAQPFSIAHAPQDVLKGTTRLYKIPGGNIYFLDPTKNRVIVTTDGGATGEASYLRQYVLEGDQLGTIQNIYVDDQESHLYVLDEKRLFVVDLAK